VAARRIIRNGVRMNKYGDVQLFYCRHCKKKFTPLVTRHKSVFSPPQRNLWVQHWRK
jgi:transposase-like protein